MQGVDAGTGAVTPRGRAGGVRGLVDVLAIDIDGVGYESGAAVAPGIALLEAEQLKLGLDALDETRHRCGGCGCSGCSGCSDRSDCMWFLQRLLLLLLEREEGTRLRGIQGLRRWSSGAVGWCEANNSAVRPEILLSGASRGVWRDTRE